MIKILDIYDAAGRCGLLTPVQVGNATIQAAFSAPDETVLDGLMLSRDYTIDYPTDTVSLKRGDIVIIYGVSYKVREVKRIHDGNETRAKLEAI